jgi:hypothetical protein
VPLDRGLLKLLDHVSVAGNTCGANVIKQQPYLHTASGDLGQSLEEIIGRGVPAHDVELDVHVPLGRADLARHGGDRLVVVAQQVGLVAPNSGQPTQPPVEYDESVQRRPGRHGQ